MKKILALIVEYKLNKSNIFSIVNQLISALDERNSLAYPPKFKDQMKSALDELQSEITQKKNNHQAILDVLEEMEPLIVDYLTSLHVASNHHCFFR